MGHLVVRFDGQRMTLRADESLGFGRSAMSPSDVKGWSYDGRFLELGADPTMHRIWGELVWRNSLWQVHALGDRDPVSVLLPGGQRIDLERDATSPGDGVLAVTASRFSVLLTNGLNRYRIDCEWEGADLTATSSAPTGPETTSLGEKVASSVTLTEYRVLWHMAREYRVGAPDGRPPEPLVYSRIQRALGETTSKAAEKAVERLVRRFRESGLLPPTVTPQEQRQWICRQAVGHAVFLHLADRYGPLTD